MVYSPPPLVAPTVRPDWSDKTMPLLCRVLGHEAEEGYGDKFTVEGKRLVGRLCKRCGNSFAEQDMDIPPPSDK